MAIAAIKNSASQVGRINRPKTDAERAHLSKIRKTWLDENPDKVPYRLNHSSRESYPEKYFAECFGDTLQREFSVGRFSLDFANPTILRYIEIDGEQHYVDPRIVQHDVQRTQKLTDLGWEGQRVRWKHFIRLDTEAKKAEVTRLLDWINLPTHASLGVLP